MTAIGIRLKDLRLQKEWTLQDLSQHTEISVAHLSNIEHGGGFTIANLIKLLNVYHVSADYVLMGKVEAEDSFLRIVRQETQDCDDNELGIITDNVIALKRILRKHVD